MKTMTLKENKRVFRISLVLGTVSLVILASYVLNEDVFGRQYNCGSSCTGGAILINVPNCLIPDVDLNHPSLIRYRQRLTKPLHLVCSDKLPLTEIKGLSLLYFEDRLASYGSTKEHVKCYYQGIQREEQSLDNYDRNCDDLYTIREKVPLKSSNTQMTEDAVVVTCEDSWREMTIYRDVHYFFQPRRAQDKRLRFKQETKALGKRPDKLNVIIMATDSVSRANMRRHMPKTFDFLKNHLHAIDLKGFHKVADNTHSNVMAMMAGLSYKDLDDIHKTRSWMEFIHDEYPFVWKEFSQEGYVTIFTEDAPRLGTFTYEKTGFLKEPTDYYTRPYFLVSESLIGHKGNGKATMAQQCQGTKWSMKLVHNSSLEFAEVFQDVPHFGLYWTCSITHDFLDLAAIADQPSVDYLKSIRDKGILKNSILFFISDHGIRFGDYRKTYTGLVEERMPYVMIVLPDGFKIKHPEAYKNLLANQERVTSTFDIHVTLRDILQRGYADLRKSVASEKYGQSLFREVPFNRTCSGAGIPEKYCACQETKEIDAGDPHLVEAAKVAVKGLNEGLQQFPNCSVLALDKVLLGRIGAPKLGTNPSHQETVFNSYIVTFLTKPGGAMMEAHMQYHNGEYYMMSDVSRINRYGNQSHCIHNFIYQKYCYCIDLLK